ncbi:MAG: hypothetical protein WCF16_08765 [Alphaproteobacteria bacterium]
MGWVDEARGRGPKGWWTEAGWVAERFKAPVLKCGRPRPFLSRHGVVVSGNSPVSGGDCGTLYRAVPFCGVPLVANFVAKYATQEKLRAGNLSFCRALLADRALERSAI